MNVRFYGVNATAGSEAMIRQLSGEAPIALRLCDIYTRHHREQLVGARLLVRSGVLGADEHSLRLYHELANEDTGAVAATFVHRLCRDSIGVDGNVATVDLPEPLLRQANANRIALPALGSARSIVLASDPIASAPSLDVLRNRDLAMRKSRIIGPDECDEAGAYLAAAAPFLTWGGEPTSNKVLEMLHELPGGVTMGWASMETRMVIARLPRLGDRVQSFSAAIALHDKVTHRVQWVYDLDRGDLLTTFEIVNLAFDIKARAAISIPANIRSAERALVHEDLAPRPWTQSSQMHAE